MNYSSPRYDFQPAPSPRQGDVMVPVMKPNSVHVRFSNLAGASHPHPHQNQQQPSYPHPQKTPPAENLLHNEDEWNRMFTWLCEYKRYHGHCHIPETCEVHTELAWWVQRQRLLRLVHPRRVERLRTIGFAWNEAEAFWRIQYLALREVHRQHGHCNSVVGTKTALGVWVDIQWNDFRRMVKGKRTNMTLERIQCLRSLGFCFNWEPMTSKQQHAPGGTKKTVTNPQSKSIAARTAVKDDDRKFLIEMHCMQLRLVHQELYQKGKLPHLTKRQVAQLVRSSKRARTGKRSSNKSKKMRTGAR